MFFKDAALVQRLVFFLDLALLRRYPGHYNDCICLLRQLYPDIVSFTIYNMTSRRLDCRNIEEKTLIMYQLRNCLLGDE